jgi:hypothetical protein
MQIMYQFWLHAVKRVMQVHWCSARARHVRVGLWDTFKDFLKLAMRQVKRYLPEAYRNLPNLFRHIF